MPKRLAHSLHVGLVWLHAAAAIVCPPPEELDSHLLRVSALEVIEMLRQCSQEASEAKTRANNKHSSEGKAQIARADEHDTGTQKPRPAHGGLQHADGRRVSENAELRPKHWHIDADADSVGMLVRSIWRRDNLVDVIMRNEPILRWPMGAGFDIYQFGDEPPT